MLLEEQVPKLLDFASRRLRRVGLRDLAAYVEVLERAAGDAEGELTRLVDRVTVCETCFYREAAQFEALGELIRDLYRRHSRPLEVWCTACSSGEEAYTVAMLAADAGIPVRILGSDVNGEALHAARAARYDAWALRRLPQSMTQRYLRREDDRFRVLDEIRSTVALRRHNLAGGEDLPSPHGAPHRGWDVILCRNLFLYFSRARVERVAGRLLGALDEDGWLFLAAAESLRGLDVPGRPAPFGGTVGYRPLRTASAPASRTAAANLPRRDGGEEIRLPPAPGRNTTVKDETDWMKLGTSLLEADQPSAALVAFREAEVQNPLNPELHYYQALVHRRQGAAELYAGALRRALFLDPGFWPAAFLLGSFHEERGERRSARSAYQQALHAGAEDREEVASRYLRFAGSNAVTKYREDVATVCRRKLGELRAD